jgi:O-acetyl-ADP-ribose deacetylase (regulator of RNase III)
MVMMLHLRDRNPKVIRALEYAFKDMPEVIVEEGEFFRQDDKIHAIVSPANSFGFMDGGIDRVYCDHLGWQVQTNVQDEIKKLPFGELLIGQAIVTKTGSDLVPWIIASPTMRMPGPTQPHCVYLAMRAAMYIALGLFDYHVACPGLGTATGRIQPADAAQAMLYGYIAARDRLQGMK